MLLPAAVRALHINICVAARIALGGIDNIAHSIGRGQIRVASGKSVPIDPNLFVGTQAEGQARHRSLRHIQPEPNLFCAGEIPSLTAVRRVKGLLDARRNARNAHAHTLGVLIGRRGGVFHAGLVFRTAQLNAAAGNHAERRAVGIAFKGHHFPHSVGIVDNRRIHFRIVCEFRHIGNDRVQLVGEPTVAVHGGNGHIVSVIFIQPTDEFRGDFRRRNFFFIRRRARGRHKFIQQHRFGVHRVVCAQIHKFQQIARNGLGTIGRIRRRRGEGHHNTAVLGCIRRNTAIRRFGRPRGYRVICACGIGNHQRHRGCQQHRAHHQSCYAFCKFVLFRLHNALLLSS